jgi:hypothetical protein
VKIGETSWLVAGFGRSQRWSEPETVLQAARLHLGLSLAKIIDVKTANPDQIR